MRFLPLILVAAVLVGCGEKYDENYKTDVKLTPEQEQAREANMAGQTPPGGVPGSGPSGLDRNAMKGK
jgi:hypothetical protein